MQETTSREKVLKKIRRALVSRGNSFYLSTDFDSPVFKEAEEEPEIEFARRLTELQGNFVFCLSEDEAIENLKGLFAERGWKNARCREEEIFYFLEAAGIEITEEVADGDTSISATLCECIVSRTGSFFISSKQQTGRRFAVDNDVHIVIAFTSQVVKDISDGFKFVRTKYEGKLPSMLTLVSGPSKTADIEQQLVHGAHGPAELFVFLIEG